VSKSRRAADRDATLSGLLLVDKPAGLSSFDVVRRARRALQVRKVGHLGTLDPFATGLLPLALGEATRLVAFLMGEPKTYRATLKLGEETDTQDLTGRVTGRWEILPTQEAVIAAAAGFVGELLQTPPMYSARHHQGRRLYRLAREGEQVELPPRPVSIFTLTVEDVALPAVTLTVRCSAGTYVRTLAQDLGRALGCGAHLTALRRLAVGTFHLDAALPLEDIEDPAARTLVETRVILPADCLPGLRALTLAPDDLRRLRQGQRIAWPGEAHAPDRPLRILADGRLAAVAVVMAEDGGTVLAPVRVFAHHEE
jgi:tRNA pseudouridine55 synthase